MTTGPNTTLIRQFRGGRKNRKHRSQFFDVLLPTNRSILSEGNLWPAVLRFSPPEKVRKQPLLQLGKWNGAVSFTANKRFRDDCDEDDLPVIRSIQFENYVNNEREDDKTKRDSIDPPGIVLDDGICLRSMVQRSSRLDSMPTQKQKGEQEHTFSTDDDFVAVRRKDDIPNLGDGSGAGDIRNYPFVYEFYNDNNLPPQSMSIVERFKRCRCVYVVWQGPQQLGSAQHLNHYHYQENEHVVVDAIKSVLDFHQHPQVVLIGASGSYEDDDIFVRNFSLDQVLIPHQLLLNVLAVTGGSSDDKSRQRDFADFGYTSSQCTARRQGCMFGLVRPRCYQATEEGKQMFEHTPKIFEGVSAAKNMTGFEIPSERRYGFGLRLGAHNSYEAIRIHKTFVDGRVKSLCRIHRDRNNSKSGCLQRVHWWSSLASDPANVSKTVRIGLVGYWRASIDDYFLRFNRHAYYLDCCHRILIEHIDVNRHRFLNTNMAMQASVPDFDFLPIRRGRCRMDIESFYQPFVFSIGSILTAHPTTSLLEAVSILLAVGRSLCSAVFSSIAIRQLLVMKGSVPDKGWMLIKLIKRIDEVNHSRKAKIPIRMGKYATMGIPETVERKGRAVWFRHVWKRKEWMAAVAVVTKEIERIRKLEKVTQDDYHRLRMSIQEIPSIGSLFSNHVIGIASLVGIVPLKLFAMVEGGANKFYKKLKDTFPNDTLPPQEEVITNVRYMAEAIFDRFITIRGGENVSCKIGRVLSKTDNRFWDVWEAMFPSFCVDYKGKTVETSVGTVIGSIFKFENNEWNCELELPKLITTRRVWMELYD